MVSEAGLGSLLEQLRVRVGELENTVNTDLNLWHRQWRWWPTLVLCCWSSALVLTDCMPPRGPARSTQCPCRLCRTGMTKVELGLGMLDARIRHSCERPDSYTMRCDVNKMLDQSLVDGKCAQDVREERV